LFTSTTIINSLDALNSHLSYRVTDLSIPSAETSTYSVDWGAWTIDRPSPKITTSREMSLSIRSDKNYDLYKIFVNWKNAIQNETTGAIGAVTSWTANILTVTIKTIDSSNGLIVLFNNIWCTSVSDLSFSQGGGDPVTFTVGLNFMSIDRNFSETPDTDGSEDTGGTSGATP
jgi:hypothetical protein